MTAKLYRSSTDKKIFGVCGGLGQTLGVDSILLRFVVVVATIFSGGTAGLLYLVAGLIIPEEPVGYIPHYAREGRDYRSSGASYSGDGHQTYRKYWEDFYDQWFGSCKSHPASKETRSRHTDPHYETADHHGNVAHGSSAGQRDSYAHSSGHPPHGTAPASEESREDNLDELMREVEAKALRQEIEELKQRLAKFEQEKGD